MTVTPAATRPAASEHAPYYGRYIALVPDGDVVAALERQIGETLARLRGFGEERAGHRYAAGKWSVRQIVGHLTDAERMFAYRALAFARGESQALPGFDENAYAESGEFDRRTLADLAAEYERVRHASVATFRGFPEAAWSRQGTANGQAISVRALVWIVAGHELHHRAILEERYG